MLDEAFGLDDAETSLLAVLMLRGPQTPGELKQRGQRLHDFASLAEVQETLDRLVERGQVARHGRRPGQKEDRYEQLLGPTSAEDDVEVVATGRESSSSGSAAEPAEPAEDRLARVEREVAELRSELVELRSALGE